MADSSVCIGSAYRFEYLECNCRSRHSISLQNYTKYMYSQVNGLRELLPQLRIQQRLITTTLNKECVLGLFRQN